MSDYWHTKGNKFFKERNFEKAYDCYTKCLSYVPENVLILSNRSLCQLKLKNYIDAEKDASSAIAVDPAFIKAFHHRALARHALLKLEEGIQDLQVCSKAALFMNHFCCIDHGKIKKSAALACVNIH
jgi:tetratricopeptide (TPR) repeat protein